jgi:hypothetical protein
MWLRGAVTLYTSNVAWNAAKRCGKVVICTRKTGESISGKY